MASIGPQTPSSLIQVRTNSATRQNQGMRVSTPQKILAAISALVGVGVFVAIYFVVQWAVRHETDTSIFLVGVMATVASPIGFGLWTTAWRLLRPPSQELIRRQAAAAKELERSLSDWEYADSQRQQAEATRATIDSYIALRTRRLDLERRRQSWDENALRLYEEHKQLTALAGALAEDEVTRISPEARATLDRVIQPKRSSLDIAFDALGAALTMSLPVIGPLVEVAFDAGQRAVRDRRAKERTTES